MNMSVENFRDLLFKEKDAHNADKKRLESTKKELDLILAEKNKLEGQVEESRQTEAAEATKARHLLLVNQELERKAKEEKKRLRQMEEQMEDEKKRTSATLKAIQQRFDMLHKQHVSNLEMIKKQNEGLALDTKELMELDGPGSGAPAQAHPPGPSAGSAGPSDVAQGGKMTCGPSPMKTESNPATSSRGSKDCGQREEDWTRHLLARGIKLSLDIDELVAQIEESHPEVHTQFFWGQRENVAGEIEPYASDLFNPIVIALQFISKLAQDLGMDREEVEREVMSEWTEGIEESLANKQGDNMTMGVDVACEAAP